MCKRQKENYQTKLAEKLNKTLSNKNSYCHEQTRTQNRDTK